MTVTPNKGTKEESRDSFVCLRYHRCFQGIAPQLKFPKPIWREGIFITGDILLKINYGKQRGYSGMNDVDKAYIVRDQFLVLAHALMEIILIGDGE